MTAWSGAHGWMECVETLLPNNTPEKQFMKNTFSEQEIEILTRNSPAALNFPIDDPKGWSNNRLVMLSIRHIMQNELAAF